MFNALGTETHLFIRHDSFLRTFDPMIQEEIGKEYERQGVILHRQSKPNKIEKDPATGKLTVHYEDSKGSGSLEGVDDLIWAIGRSAEVDDLNLEKAGVRLNDKGYISVNEYQDTNVEGVHALG